jgi:D-sedoheptulose 7-phosphate isomerase
MNKKIIFNLDYHINLLKLQKKEILHMIGCFSHELISAINRGNKIFIIGNGGSAADAQHLATEMTVKMGKKRKSLPFIALTTDTSAITATGNDFRFNKIFSRQLEGLGQKNDILISISTSGNSPNILEALKIAKKRKIKTLSILGNKGGKAKKNSDLSFIVKSNNPSRIQEIHIIFYQNFCHVIDDYFAKKNK